jgi:YesN/AraC family two-component response regulator
MIFLVYRLYLNPQADEDISLPQEKQDMEQVVLYLNMHYMEKISIEELTGIFHINRTTLNEKFAKITGVSIRKYIINLRIRISCMILRDTMLPVEEIMERIGYYDAAHFGKTFRKLIGCAPTEYRNSYCWMRH